MNKQEKNSNYWNVDYASNLIDQKFTTKYIFTFNEESISWSSRKQITVAQSIMKAKYMALFDVIRELLARIYVINELDISIIKSTIVYSDNQATIAMTQKKEIIEESNISTLNIISYVIIWKKKLFF